jgi:hypothetical protein
MEVAKCGCLLIRWVSGGGQMLTSAKKKKKISKEKTFNFNLCIMNLYLTIDLCYKRVGNQ